MNDGPLQKVTLNLHQGDFERLRDFYPDLGASVVVRRLVRKHIEKLEGDQELPTVEVKL